MAIEIDSSPATRNSRPKKKTARTGRRQCAVLPFRFNRNGDVEVMLITSRGTGRWVIPKGWPMTKMSRAATAMVEAYEEAGLRGQLTRKRRFGSYSYKKPELNGSKGDLVVDVYLMQVDEELAEWPESTQRRRDWFRPFAASLSVAESELGNLILGLPKALKTLGVSGRAWDDQTQALETGF